MSASGLSLLCNAFLLFLSSALPTPSPPLVVLQTSCWEERFYIPQQLGFQFSSVDLTVRNTAWWLRRAQQKRILSTSPCPECSSAESRRCPRSPAPWPSTQSSASVSALDCSSLRFYHKGSLPKPSLLQQQHLYPCGPQPSSSYLINSFWQKGESLLEHSSARASFWPKVEVALWSWQTFLI